MQDVVKERHPAKDQQNTAQPALGFGAVQQSEQNERRSQCHEQVVERRRILQRVEE